MTANAATAKLQGRWQPIEPPGYWAYPKNAAGQLLGPPFIRQFVRHQPPAANRAMTQPRGSADPPVVHVLAGAAGPSAMSALQPCRLSLSQLAGAAGPSTRCPPRAVVMWMVQSSSTILLLCFMIRLELRRRFLEVSLSGYPAVGMWCEIFGCFLEMSTSCDAR